MLLNFVTTSDWGELVATDGVGVPMIEAGFPEVEIGDPQGELAALESAWREAEEIAAIAGVAASAPEPQALPETAGPAASELASVSTMNWCFGPTTCSTRK